MLDAADNDDDDNDDLDESGAQGEEVGVASVKKPTARHLPTILNIRMKRTMKKMTRKGTKMVKRGQF